jgi:hypothetical protein
MCRLRDSKDNAETCSKALSSSEDESCAGRTIPEPHECRTTIGQEELFRSAVPTAVGLGTITHIPEKSH